MKSINNMLICEPYQGTKGVKAKINNGVSIIQQKIGVLGLKVLMDAVISKDITVKAGSTVYIKEEVLYTYTDQYQKALDCKAVGQPFVLANYGHVLFIEE